MKDIAKEVAVVPLKIANVYVVGTKDLWFLVDTGLPGEAEAIKKAVETRFGPQAKPAAIVLTHGHPDHAGSAGALADTWSVKVHAHRLEIPYISGQAKYPPADPTAPGFLSFMSRFFPNPAIDVGPRLTPLNEADPFPGLTGWQVIPTPGHAPGQVAFFRPGDGLLLAGDAFTTANFESPIGFFTQKQELCRPPVAATFDWPQARESVAALARLKPNVLAAGHGKPMSNQGNLLQELADHFQIPTKGRYAEIAAQVGEHGVTALPPQPPDHFVAVSKSLLVAGLALGVGAAYPAVRSRLKKASPKSLAQHK